jgi:putative membrane protein
MREQAFLTDVARRRADAAVKAVEAQTSAELVVAVRRQSSAYRSSSYLFGLLCSGAAFLFLYFSPRVYRADFIPLELLLMFGLGFAVCSVAPPLRRLLTRQRERRARVATAARAAFYDLGISRTTGRNGVLIFVSLFERIAEAVPDIKVDTTALGEGWRGAMTSMQTAVERRDLEGLFTAMETLGPVLGKAMPRQPDDLNELPDEPM